jgi:hypothetical protein
MQINGMVGTMNVMENRRIEFLFRPRDSRKSRRVAAMLLRMALLVIVLALYWRWNHHARAIGLMFPRERKLATANAFCLLDALGPGGLACRLRGMLGLI